ncbi:MAG: arginase family protein, partial [Vicingaceae bacterium]
ILPEDLIFFGLRDTEEPENELIRRLGIKNFSVTECREKGFDQAVQEALEKLNQCDFIYISFDVDSMDSDKVSEGTGTPVPDGFLPAEAQCIISGLIDSGKVGCFEMVEVNPTLDDQKNKMAETAFQILETTAQKIEQYFK